MKFRKIEPHPFIRNYIEKMWVFESNGKMPCDDMKLIIPNGRPKLTIPFRNSLVGLMNGKSYISKEHSITLTGLADKPIVLDMGEDVKSGTIGIEFSPAGAYRFFQFPLSGIQNVRCSLIDILGNSAKQLQEEIINEESTDGKVRILQLFLCQQLRTQGPDPIFEYCVGKIKSSNGSISIKELERKTGYSSRWLNMKFVDKIGVGPKKLCSIVRFKRLYETMANNDESVFTRKEIYESYYDLSHFTKDFERFTGLPYSGFKNANNDFGKAFYKE